MTNCSLFSLTFLTQHSCYCLSFSLCMNQQEVSKSVPKLISFLIDHCPDLFGESVLTLLGTELETRPRPDSGTDSMNSLQDVSSMSLQKDVRAIITSSSSSSEESETPSTSSPSVLRIRPVEYYPSNVVLHCMCYACQNTRSRTERELRRITWSPWSSLDTLVWIRCPSNFIMYIITPLSSSFWEEREDQAMLMKDWRVIYKDNCSRIKNTELTTSTQHLNSSRKEVPKIYNCIANESLCTAWLPHT